MDFTRLTEETSCLVHEHSVLPHRSASALAVVQFVSSRVEMVHRGESGASALLESSITVPQSVAVLFCAL